MVDATLPMTPLPNVSAIGLADIRVACKAGLADFQRAPVFGLFFGAVFSLVGIVITYLLYSGDWGLWLFPIAAGFPLIGPFAAVGLYEVSRRLESGEPLHWGPILGAGFRQGNSQLPFFAVFSVFSFLVWIVLARVIFAVTFGTTSMTNVLSSFGIFFSLPGLSMLVLGSVVGAALAALLFSVSVVAVPMLLDRDIDFVTAMITSFRATLENRAAMLYWGLLIGLATALAMLPLFLGMIVVFPALGHCSWHVYRAVID